MIQGLSFLIRGFWLVEKKSKVFMIQGFEIWNDTLVWMASTQGGFGLPADIGSIMGV